MDLLNNIPDELKELNQWVLWKYEQTESKPTKIPYSTNGYKASVTNPNNWCSFAQAFDSYLTGQFSGLGFVLTDEDPYVFIDLDQAKDEHDSNLQHQIYNTIDSYAELSPSGTGLHIICKGKVGTGKKKFSSEIYFSQRYMTMTGNVYRNTTINDASQHLPSLWEYLGGSQETEKACLLDQNSKQHADDNTIINRAAAAENGQLFKDLFTGDWQKHSYKWSDQSQSCADQALINIVQFYTKDIFQIKRIFKQSALGQREKAQRDGYLTLCVRKAFDRELPQVDTSALVKGIQAAIEAQNKPYIDSDGVITDQKSMLIRSESPDFEKACLLDSTFSVPPGLIGRIAQFIYQHSPRPVAEIALGAALGLTAGICGRCYNISGSGLNHYVLILAATGTGKESASSGIHTLLNAAKIAVPTITEFIGPTTISSPQALIKKLSKHKSFVSIIGEFGLKLQEMNHRNANPASKGVQTVFLDIFQKSGKGQVFGAMAYSDSEKNIDSILSPAFSLLGESTQNSFYEAIDERSIESGFIPRLTVVEYKGDRPPLNENRAKITDYYDLVDDLAKLAAQSQMLNNQNQIIDIEQTPEANQILKAYNLFADSHIIGATDVNRQIWTRAHLKVLKLAGLLAVGQNPYNPIVTTELANYAINLENTNIKNMLFKFASGAIGANHDVNEQKQIREVTHTIKQWLVEPYEKLKTYKAGNQVMHDLKVIPYKFLILKLSNTRTFKDDKAGSTRAIQRALKSLEDTGDIQGTKDKYKYDSTALVYAVLNVNHFL